MKKVIFYAALCIGLSSYALAMDELKEEVPKEPSLNFIVNGQCNVIQFKALHGMQKSMKLNKEIFDNKIFCILPLNEEQRGKLLLTIWDSWEEESSLSFKTEHGTLNVKATPLLNEKKENSWFVQVKKINDSK